MRLGSRIFITMAAFILLVPALLLSAEAAVKPSAGAKDKASDSRVAPLDVDQADLTAQPADALPATPVPPLSRTYSNTPNTPKVELFLGYSYLRGVPTYATGNRMVGLNGGDASIAFNLNHYLGLVADFSGFNDTKLQLTGAGANPPGVTNASGTAFTYLFGPRFSYRKYERITPFAQALFGGVHASDVTLSGCTGALCTPLPAQNAFAMTAGGGLDVKVQRHVAIRIIQAEYLMTRFADVGTGAGRTQNDIRLSSGVVFRLGGNNHSPLVTYTCVASPASVYPGDPITVTGTALNLDPKKAATYTWTADGGKISGTTGTASIDTSSAAPGSYTVTGHVSEGVKPGRFADCSAPYAVMAVQPPTVSCSANPSTVHPGESVTITAQGTSPQNRPLTYSYSATEGSITGTASSATLSTASTSPGTITATCNVVDDKGQTASSTATVTVQALPPPPSPTTQKLCSVNFERDTKRPTRVDNEAKACLDDIALNLQHSSDAKVALVGNSDTREKASEKRATLDDATQRAVNTKDYLVTDKGIDASRVVVYTGSSDGKTVDTTLIPSGAALDTTGLVPVDESVKPLARKTAPKKLDKK
jgi:opacity protein-like surface antigen/outer membrane protein OmpA-like peptidoglycan-associated protein